MSRGLNPALRLQDRQKRTSFSWTTKRTSREDCRQTAELGNDKHKTLIPRYTFRKRHHSDLHGGLPTCTLTSSAECAATCIGTLTPSTDTSHTIPRLPQCLPTPAEASDTPTESEASSPRREEHVPQGEQLSSFTLCILWFGNFPWEMLAPMGCLATSP